jgi:hypothetical protein
MNIAKKLSLNSTILGFALISFFLFTGASINEKTSLKIELSRMDLISLNQSKWQVDSMPTQKDIKSQTNSIKDSKSPLDSRVSGVLPIKTAQYYERNYQYYMNYMVANKPSDINAYEESLALTKAIERSQNMSLEQTGYKVVYGLKSKNDMPREFLQIVYPIDAKGNIAPLKRGYINVHCVFIPAKRSNEKSSLVCPPYCD